MGRSSLAGSYHKMQLTAWLIFFQRWRGSVQNRQVHWKSGSPKLRQLLRREGPCSESKQKLFDSVRRMFPQLRRTRVKSIVSLVAGKWDFIHNYAVLSIVCAVFSSSCRKKK